MFMFGDQQSRPICVFLFYLFSSTPYNQRDLISTPITDPIPYHTDLLKVAPSIFGFGKDVGQTVPSEPHLL